MRTTKVFKGFINGFKALAYDQAPLDMTVTSEHVVYVPDDDSIFKKGDEEAAVIFADDDNINDWQEVKIPEE